VSLPPADDAEPPLNFSEILTTDSVLTDVRKMALRYSDAILAYATALLGDPEEAQEVHLALVQKMLEGDFRRASVKGRFRFYVKQAVHNAVLDHVKKRARETGRLRRLWNALVTDRRRRGKAMGRAADLPAEADLERREREIWRATVLRRTLEGLEKYERQHQERAQPNVYHTLSGLLVDHPGETSDELARRLGQDLGGSYNAAQVRGIVLRMRRKFAQLLFTEVAQHFVDPTYEDVIDELCDLSLYGYAEPYLPPKRPAAPE
jgi:hypothetical protein